MKKEHDLRRTVKKGQGKITRPFQKGKGMLAENYEKIRVKQP